MVGAANVQDHQSNVSSLSFPREKAGRIRKVPIFRFHVSAINKLPEHYEDAAVRVFDKMTEKIRSELFSGCRIELFVDGDPGCIDESYSRSVNIRIVRADDLSPLHKYSHHVCSIGRDSFDEFESRLEARIIRMIHVSRYYE